MMRRVGLFAGIFLPVVLISVAATWVEANDPGRSAQKGTESSGVPVKSAEDEDGAGVDDGKKVDPGFIGGNEVETRSFLVRIDGVNVGASELTVREFQDRALYRTGMEYWLFSQSDDNAQCHFWFQGYCSEFADKRPVALWGTGHLGKAGLSFRLQGDGGWLSAERNYYGEKRLHGKRIRPPKGYRVIGQLRVLMREAIKDGSQTPFEWQRCDWRADEVKWDTLKYTYAGKESVATADGSRLDAHRFKIHHVDGRGPQESVWVDDGALPVRRLVGGEKGFELLYTTGKPKDHLASFPRWDEVVEKMGRDRVESLLSAADIAF